VGAQVAHRAIDGVEMALEDGPPQVGVAEPVEHTDRFRGGEDEVEARHALPAVHEQCPAAGSPTFEHGRQLGRFAGSDQAEAMGAAAEPLPCGGRRPQWPSSVAARSRSAK